MAEFRVRHLIVVLGDQLDPSAAAFDGSDPACDVVWMAEVAEESTHVWSTKMRTALFLSAMRHFAHDRRADADLRIAPLAGRGRFIKTIPWRSDLEDNTTPAFPDCRHAGHAGLCCSAPRRGRRWQGDSQCQVHGLPYP